MNFNNNNNIFFHYRKLKNRVAAQNARDRKKERLEQLEIIVTHLEKEVKFTIKAI